MKQYLLAVHMVEGEPQPSQDEIQQAYQDVDAVNAEMQRAGAWVFGGGLHPPATATVVKVSGGEVVTTDGPFAETKEQLGGYFLVDCADLDEAIAGIVASAFGYAGQKCSACSRVIAVGDVHDRLLARLAEAADALPWGPPEDPAYPFGPLIDEPAQRKALGYLDVGRAEGRLVWQGRVPERGWYVPPTIFADIRPQHRLAREEIFAPILSVLAAPDFRTALAMAQDSDYALTGGVYSRLPDHLALAQQSYRVGDLYLNRRITGARVGIQPFGGVALSGTGVQAGGPDYLKQFLWTRVVSANVMRHGLIAGQGNAEP